MHRQSFRKALPLLICLALALTGSAFAIEPPKNVETANVAQTAADTAVGKSCNASPEFLSAGPGLAPQSDCSATCADGSTIEITNCPGTCTAQDTDCGANIQGSVTCGPVTQTCTATCGPPIEPPCPTTWPCNYKYFFASGCCIDQLQDPAYHCPAVCN